MPKALTSASCPYIARNMNKEELTVVIPEDSVEELKKELDKRNRRLERAGVTERFELTVGEPFCCRGLCL